MLVIVIVLLDMIHKEMIQWCDNEWTAIQLQCSKFSVIAMTFGVVAVHPCR